MATTVVFSGGPIQASVLSTALSIGLGSPAQPPERIIAADSGLESCLAAGLGPDVVVGDMDSVDPRALARAGDMGARIERHPADKDAVDLELALDAALEFVPGVGAAGRLVVIGSPVGRLDHLVASIQLLGSPRYAAFEVVAVLGAQSIIPVHRDRTLEEPVGTTVSLLALHGGGSRVTASGLRWPLRDRELQPSNSLGVSNEFAESTARIEVAGPPVTVVLPGGQSGPDATPNDPARTNAVNQAPGGGAP